MIVFDVPLHLVLTLVAGTILPLLVGLVTTRATSPGTKAVALAAISVAASLLTELAAALQSGTEYNLGMALLASLGVFLVAVGTHYGLWKPTGVSGAAQEHLRTAEVPDGTGEHRAQPVENATADAATSEQQAATDHPSAPVRPD